MKILPFALLAAALLVNHSSLAQTESAPVQPAAPAASSSKPEAGPSGLKSGTGAMAVAPATTSTRQITVASLTEKEIKGQDGSDLGEINRVVESTADKKTYVVVNRGGFFGFFGTEYLVPVDQIAITGEEIVAKNMTPKQLESTTPFVTDAATYRLLDDTTTVSVPEPR